ncbi:MAG: rhodanese-like domain-containing protein [Burkholderiales bacterium]|nr:rhodanese-like domain-containing protein [Burkholderiales bacterium]
MTHVIKSLLLIFLLVFNAGAFADPIVPVPEQIPGTKRVDAEAVIEVAGKLKNLVIVDSRIPDDRKIGYIEHSISLPDAKTNCKSLAKIIPGKSTPVLFYCNGVKCGRSVVATKIALKCGYKNIYWFRGGFEEWKSKEYPFLHE